MTSLRKRMLDELQLRNLSACTTRAYVGTVERFSKYFQKSPEKLGPEQVREYLLHLIRDKESLPNTVVVNRSGLRFLYVCTLKKNWFEESVPEPKRRPILPRILSVGRGHPRSRLYSEYEALDHSGDARVKGIGRGLIQA